MMWFGMSMRTAGRILAEGGAVGAAHDMDTDFPAAAGEAVVIAQGAAVLFGDGPEVGAKVGIELPAGVGDSEAERAVGGLGAAGKTVNGENEVALGLGIVEPGHEGAKHTAGDAAAFVLGRDMDGPDVDASGILQVDGDAAYGGVALAGDEVAVAAFGERPFESGGSPGRIAEVAGIEGAEGEATFAPGGKLTDEAGIPGAEDEPILAFDEVGVECVGSGHMSPPGGRYRGGSRGG